MKNFKMSKKLLPLMLLPLADFASAASEPFSVGFTTLPEISITPITNMAFGPVLKLGSTDICEMLADAANNLGSTSIEKSAGSGTPGGNPGQMAQTCAGQADGVLGVYEVTGLSGTTVTIILAGETNADIQFEPAGYTWDFLSDAYKDLDDTNAGVTSQLADGADANADITPGIARLILGGSITNQRALTAGDSVSASFDISVNY
jgi:hypothetical protein